jgi:hypothetical protein
MGSGLTATEVAMIDAMKSIIEVVVAKRVATHEEFATPLTFQRDACRDRGNADGAAVFGLLIDWCKRYGDAHALIAAEPRGSA